MKQAPTTQAAALLVALFLLLALSPRVFDVWWRSRHLLVALAVPWSNSSENGASLNCLGSNLWPNLWNLLEPGAMLQHATFCFSAKPARRLFWIFSMNQVHDHHLAGLLLPSQCAGGVAQGKTNASCFVRRSARLLWKGRFHFISEVLPSPNGLVFQVQQYGGTNQRDQSQINVAQISKETTSFLFYHWHPHLSQQICYANLAQHIHILKIIPSPNVDAWPYSYPRKPKRSFENSKLDEANLFVSNRSPTLPPTVQTRFHLDLHKNHRKKAPIVAPQMSS